MDDHAKYTICDLWLLYLEGHAKPTFQENTLKKITNCFNSRAFDAVRDRHCLDLKHHEIQSWSERVASEHSTGVAIASRELLRAIYYWAVKQSLIEPWNPAVLSKKMCQAVQKTAKGQRFIPTKTIPRRHLSGELAAELDDVQQVNNPDVENLQTISISKFSEIYIERWAKVRKKTWHEDQRRIDLYINPYLGALNLNELTKGRVSQLLFIVGTKQAKPVAANRLMEQLRKMYNLAIDWEFLPVDFRNPAKGIARFKEKSRTRFLSTAEYERVIESLAKERSVYVRAAFLLLMFTALRKSEILSLRWEHVDLEAAIAKILAEDTKNEDDLFQHLSPQAIRILSVLPREGEFVICQEIGRGGRVVDKAKNNITKAWDRIRKRANVPDVTIHDLRRSGGTFLVRDGFSLPIIGKVLNHRDSKSTLVYARLVDTDKNLALNRLGEHVGNMAISHFKELRSVPANRAGVTT